MSSYPSHHSPCRPTLQAHAYAVSCSVSIFVNESYHTLTSEVQKFIVRRWIAWFQVVGCYMFRLDESTVIDATFAGSAARFINHSCDANCCSRRRRHLGGMSTKDLVSSLHIVIVAKKQIKPGEELTYNYKFPVEDSIDERKLLCLCGSRRCRKYLN